MEHDTPGFARILKEYGSVSWDFRATTRLFSRSVKNGTLPVQVAFAREYFHLEQNVAVVLYQITQLAVFPFVEFSRALRCRGCRGLCFLYITCRSWQSDGKLKKLLKCFKIPIGEYISRRDIILSYKFHYFEKAPSMMGKFLLL